MTTIAEKILESIDAHQPKVKEYDGPFELTYDGISKSTGVSREVICTTLSKMMRRGELVYVQRHVPGSKTRRRLYLRPDSATLADQRKSDWAKLHSELQRVNASLRALQNIADRLNNTGGNITQRR